jgi:SAM-dependent methyltransferase
MKIDNSVENFYNKNIESNYADNYDIEHGSRIDWIINRFKLNEIHNQKIIDIGCGMGNFFKRMDPSNTFIGIDGALIPKKICNFLLLKMNLDEPFSYIFDNEEKFDFLIASEVIEHVSGLDNIMIEMKKLLKENAYAIFTIPHQSTTHPTIYPGIFYPENNFKIFIEQYGWIVEDIDYCPVGCKSVCFLVKNLSLDQAKPMFPKNEIKFLGKTPREYTNL